MGLLNSEKTILYLGDPDTDVFRYLKRIDPFTIYCTEKVDLEFLRVYDFDFAVSYNYRHILKKPILDFFKGNIVNMHIAYLPYNRGADPNLWSFIEGTPKGVTIHYMDEGIDTGDIIYQKKVKFKANDTLSTSYAKLHKEIQELFIDNWKNIVAGNCPRKKQRSKGTYHQSAEKKELPNGWDTLVKDLRG